MTVKLVPFFSNRDDYPPRQEKGGIVGTISLGSAPLANLPSPRARWNQALKPVGPEQRIGPGMPWRLSAGCSGTSHPECLLSRYDLMPECLFSRMLLFPISDFAKRNCQPALHDISICSPKNQPPRLQRNRKALTTAAHSGKQLHKMKNKSSFLK